MALEYFPGIQEWIHGLAALAAFVTFSLSAIAAYRLEKRPLNYISAIIGVFSLIVLFLAFYMGEASPFWLTFGGGGEERFVAYPVVLWIIGFGGYLMEASSTNAGQ